MSEERTSATPFREPPGQAGCVRFLSMKMGAGARRSPRGIPTFSPGFPGRLMRVSFDGFVLDTAARQLLRAGTRVHLEPKALELLELLVARRPEAVSKSEIQERLWPDTFVSESSLTSLVAQVRKALGDDRRQERFLRTVHGFGYAFSGEIAAGAAGSRRIRRPGSSGRTSVFLLQPGDNLLGRSEEASVRIDVPGSVTTSRAPRRDGRRCDDRGPREQERDVRGGAAGRGADSRSTTANGCAWAVSSSCSAGSARRPRPGRKALRRGRAGDAAAFYCRWRRKISITVSSVSASAAGLSGRWRLTRAKRKATPAG